MQGDTQVPPAAEPTLTPPPTGEPMPQFPTAASPNTEGNRLEKILPELQELAQKVGGYDKLAELARELSRTGR
jgi:hypothetical protein